MGHETPYCHVHITVLSASQTVCGHLMEVSTLDQITHDGKADVPTHFSVAIAGVSGGILRMHFDKNGIVPA